MYGVTCNPGGGECDPPRTLYTCSNLWIHLDKFAFRKDISNICGVLPEIPHTHAPTFGHIHLDKFAFWMGISIMWGVTCNPLDPLNTHTLGQICFSDGCIQYSDRYIQYVGCYL